MNNQKQSLRNVGCRLFALALACVMLSSSATVFGFGMRTITLPIHVMDGKGKAVPGAQATFRVDGTLGTCPATDINGNSTCTGTTTNMGAGQTTVAAFGTVSPAPGLTWNTPSATYYQAYHAGMGNETLTNQNILLPLPALETVHLGVGVTITNSRGVIRLAPDGSDVTFTIMQNDGGNHQAKTVKISNGQAVADFTVIKACTQGWQGFYQSAASPLRWINPATRTSDDAHIDAYEP